MESKALNERRVFVLSQMVEIVNKYFIFETQNIVVREYVFQGFIRRLTIMKTCIKNVFLILPLDREKPLSQEQLDNLYINLHAYIINSFGCLDNLARIWVEEKKILNSKGEPLNPMKIGLSKKCKDVRNSFSKSFQDIIIENSKVFKILENYRHSLAHRIPLYVPSAILTQKENARQDEIDKCILNCYLTNNLKDIEALKNEKRNLGAVCFQMRGSFSENAALDGCLHEHILDIWDYINVIADGFISELHLKN